MKFWDLIAEIFGIRQSTHASVAEIQASTQRTVEASNRLVKRLNEEPMDTFIDDVHGRKKKRQ